MSANTITAAEPTGDAAQPAAMRLAAWLLDGPAQLRDGPHAGALAGSLEPEGKPSYAYPEITGYFLQWLAWRARRHGGAARYAPKAAAAQAWLARWCGAERPPMRVHLDRLEEDWRNRTVFTFDVAMVLRGLASAAGQSLLTPDVGLVQALCGLLQELIGDDGVFDPCHAHADLPQRWSTRRGAFLAKAAAGVLRAAQHLPQVPPRVRRAADATLTAATRWAIESPHDDVHALLYTLEGVLSLPAHPACQRVLPSLARRFEDLATVFVAREHVPEALSVSDGLARADVLAQTIRVGDLLQRSMRAASRPDFTSLRNRLALAVRDDGAVPFAMHVQTSALNVWAAMFASQALEGIAAGEDDRDGDPLLV